MDKLVTVNDLNIRFVINEFEDHLEVLRDIGFEKEIKIADAPEVHEVEKEPCKRHDFEDEES